MKVENYTDFTVKIVFTTTDSNSECEIGENSIVELLRSIPDAPEYREIFSLAATHPSFKVRAVAASKSHLESKAIRALCCDPSLEVRIKLVESDDFVASVSEGTLTEFIQADPMIAEAVAEQLERFPPHLTIGIATILADHSDPAVRHALAENWATPNVIRDRLATDADPEIRIIARSRTIRAAGNDVIGDGGIDV